MDESLRALGRLIHAVDRRLDGEATARSLAQSAGVVRSVYELSADDLLLHPGLSRPAAEAVDLIDDLGRLMALEAFGRRPVFHRAAEAAAYFSALMLGRRVEYCYLLCLDAHGRMRGASFCKGARSTARRCTCATWRWPRCARKRNTRC